ncbi:hypothetical protein M1D47_21830 [Bacillus sp. R1-10]
MDKGVWPLRDHNAGFFINGRTGDSFTGYNGNGNITIEGGTLDGTLQLVISIARGLNSNFNSPVSNTRFISFVEKIDGDNYYVDIPNSTPFRKAHLIAERVLFFSFILQTESINYF